MNCGGYLPSHKSSKGNIYYSSINYQTGQEPAPIVPNEEKLTMLGSEWQILPSVCRTNQNTQKALSTGLVYVVVQFYPWFNLYFPLFFFMLIYDNDYETKENKS